MSHLNGSFRRPSRRPDPKAILDTLEEFINAPTWADSRRVLEQHSELLSDDADALLELVAQAQEDPRARELVEEHRAFLRRCREGGIDGALGDISARSDERMLDACQEFTRAPTWAERRRIVEQRPELLSGEADALLERVARAQENPLARQSVERHRALLHRCRDVGIEAAFRETPGYEEERILDAFSEFIDVGLEGFGRILEQHPELLGQKADSLLEDLAQRQENSQGRRMVEEYRRLLRRCREVGTEAALAEQRAAQERLDAFYEFLYAANWEESRRIVEEHPELLDDQADALFELAVEAQEDPEARRRVEERCAVLRRCREVGIDAAIGEIPPPHGQRERQPQGEGLAIPPAFVVDLRRVLEAEQRCLRGTDLGALDEAVAAWERIIRHAEFATSEPSFRQSALGQSGVTYLRRFEATEHAHDLNRALNLLQQALEQTSPGSPDRGTILNNLGLGLRYRYKSIGAPADLERAIEAFEQAVDETPLGSPHLPIRLNNLSLGLLDRYNLRTVVADLEKAIRAVEQAVEQARPGTPELPAILNSLGVALRVRHARTGASADLERAIEAFEQAIAQSPPDSPDLPGYLISLGNGLADRHNRTGELGDLERAVQAYEQAAARIPRGSAVWRMLSNDLSGVLIERHLRTGDPVDLDRAIEAFEQALEETPVGSPEAATILSNLGVGLWKRYDRARASADLTRAIEALEQAVEQTPPGSSELPRRLSNLGAGLIVRHKRTGASADLDQAIQAFEQAIARTEADSPDLPGYLSNLGVALSDRHAQMGAPPDLERTIQVFEQAVEHTPPGAPEVTSILNNLGLELMGRYKLTEELPDLHAAIGTWERAWSLLETAFVSAPVAYKLGQQREWVGRYVHLVEAHLDRAKASPPEAPAACRRAMEVAEGRKSRLLTELVGWGDIPAPLTISREETKREKELLDALTRLDTADLATHGHPAMPQEQAGRLDRLQRREQHRQELGLLWEAIAQSGPEAADYVALRRGGPLDWSELANLAADAKSDTALLSLVTGDYRTLLFALREPWHEPAVVEADLDGHAWANIAGRFSQEIHGYDHTGRRGETWDRPLWPLLEKAAVHLSGVERIIFAPEGFAHLLPWSVVAWRAGLRGPDGLALPLVTLPALGVLPRLRRRPAGRGSGALVVGNPGGDLTHAEGEAWEVAKMLGAAPLIGQQATKDAVLERLSDASVVHLATHAGFVPGSPLDSGIVLANGILTAREVMSHRLKADLLVLSACQTGMSGALGGDEMAGLAQAFLQAGARSLVVSLWSVNDPATAALMTSFYAACQAGADKAVALSRAMAEVRARERWSHSYYWGAFVLMGDWA